MGIRVRQRIVWLLLASFLLDLDGDSRPASACVGFFYASFLLDLDGDSRPATAFIGLLFAPFLLHLDGDSRPAAHFWAAGGVGGIGGSQ